MNWLRRLTLPVVAPLRALLIVIAPFLLTGVIYLLYSPTGGALLLQILGEATHGAIRSRAVGGALTGPLTLDGLVYEDQHTLVEVEHAELDWNLYGLLFRQARVLSLHVTQARLHIKDTPPDPVEHDVLTHLPVALLVKQARIDSFVIVEKNTQLRFDNVQLSAGWSGDAIDVESLTTHYAPLGDLSLKGKLRMEPRQLRIVDADVGGYGGLKVSGVIGYKNHFSLDAQWKDLRWPQGGEPAALSPAGRLHAEGSWDNYLFKLDGDVTRAPLSATLNALGHGSDAGLDITQFHAQALKGTVAGKAYVHWSPQLSLGAQGVAQNLDPSQLSSQWPGRIGGSFKADARWPGGAMDADFEVALRDSQLRTYPFALETHGAYKGGVLMLAQFDARSGGSKLQLQGRASAPYDLKASLDSPDLATLWPQLKGSAALSGSLAGTLDEPQITARGQLKQVHYGNYSVEQADLDADLHPQKSSHLNLELSQIVAGILVPSVKLHAEGTAARNQLSFSARTQGGDVDLGLRGALDIKARRWSGELASGHGAPVQLPDWKLESPADLTVSQDAVALEPACWRSSSGRACVQLHRHGDETRLAFRLQDWAFAYFQSFLPPQWTVAGSASGTGLLVLGADGLRSADVDLSTTAGRLNVGKQLAMSFEPSHLHAGEEASGLVFQLRVPMQQGGIDVDAHLGANADLARRPLRGQVQIDFSDLTPLRMLTPEIESVAGHIVGRFTLGGTAAVPRAEGSLKLSDGSLRLATLGIELKPVEAELRSSAGSNVITFNASAGSGGGTLKVEGSTDPLSQDRTLNLSVTGDQFQAVNIPQARVWVSPDLRFSLTRTRADLTGEVQVPRADITPRSFAQGVAPSHDQVIIGPSGAAPETGLLKIYSQVRVVLGDAVRFEGFGLKAKMEGAIQVVDEPMRPTTARGEVRVSEGRYKAYGQDLTIETGRLIYNGGILTDPAIELRAVRNPTEEISVGIYARGRLAAPEFTLFSTPDMPQDQQLSWLVLGRPLEESSTTATGTTTTPGEGNAVSNAALSLGVSGGSYLAQKFGSGLKLDEISIASQPGQTADQAQFTVGKYLSPRLYISYGIGVFQPGHSFRLLYDLTRHIKLSTESGIESGGDVLYTIEH